MEKQTHSVIPTEKEIDYYNYTIKTYMNQLIKYKKQLQGLN